MMSRRLSQTQTAATTITNSATSNPATNPAFSLAGDDVQPPPYSAIYPFPVSELGSAGLGASATKLNSAASLQPTTILVAERHAADSASNAALSRSSSSSDSGPSSAASGTVQSGLLPASRHISSASLFQYAQEPMSYEELFQTSDPNSNLVYVNTNTGHVRSGHYAYDNQSTDRMTPVVLQRRQHVSLLRKQLEMQFPKAYFFKHSIFIILTSITLIIFQIVLMANDALLSNLSSGIWAGLACLFTILLSILTMKFAKVWLVVISILVHLLCITFGLGSLLIINCIAATQYSSCSSYLNFEGSYAYGDQQNCSAMNLKYANIAIIILGASCMIMLVTFFFKLITVFNNSQVMRQ